MTDLKCPCCGRGEQTPGPHKFAGISIDPAKGTVTHQDVTLRFTQLQIQLFTAIVQAWPNYCRKDALLLIIRERSDRELDCVSNNLAVHISRLRSHLQDLGLGIETKYTEGYKLNTNPGMRTIRSWSEEERLAVIEQRNKGISWKDIGSMFSCTPSAARGIADHAATRLGLPLLRRRKFRAVGAKPGVRRGPERNNSR